MGDMKERFPEHGIKTRTRPNVGRDDLVTHVGRPPECVRATLPIGLCRIQEEPLVKQSNVMKGFRAQQQHGAGHKVLRRRKSPEPARFEPRARWSRKRPNDALGLAIDIYKSWSDRGHPVVHRTMQSFAELPKFTRAQHRIRIE